jgi:hypothetical protein
VGQMKIENASRYPKKEVEKLVRFALGSVPNSAKRNLEIHVKNTKYAFYGRIYSTPQTSSNDGCVRSFLILAKIGSKKRFPFLSQYPDHKRCRKYAILLADWKEALVKVVAHESVHLEQWIEGKPMREERAEKRAVETVMEYRTKHG